MDLTNRNILEESYYLVKQNSRSGNTELLPLMKSFVLKEQILYSHSGKSGKCFTS
jgi:hypothetical protein